jgi:hypothetical protein
MVMVFLSVCERVFFLYNLHPNPSPKCCHIIVSLPIFKASLLGLLKISFESQNSRLRLTLNILLAGVEGTFSSAWKIFILLEEKIFGL